MIFLSFFFSFWHSKRLSFTLANSKTALWKWEPRKQEDWKSLVICRNLKEAFGFSIWNWVGRDSEFLWFSINYRDLAFTWILQPWPLNRLAPEPSRKVWPPLLLFPGWVRAGEGARSSCAVPCLSSNPAARWMEASLSSLSETKCTSAASPERDHHSGKYLFAS